MRLSTWLLVPPTLALACGGGGGGKEVIDSPGPDAPTPADCLEAEQHSDLTWIQANIFAKSCTFSGCHGAPVPQAGLDLSTVDMAEATTVMVPSAMCPSDPGGGSQYRVVPGDPDASWMMKMVGQESDNTPASCTIDPKVGLMPMDNNNELLCSQKLAAIERWIASGAPDE
jgi:hypothetical protein